MLSETATAECPPPETPIVNFSKALLKELMETFDCTCSLLYLATPNGFGLMTRDHLRLLSDPSRKEIAQGIRAALDSKTPSAFAIGLEDVSRFRYHSIVFSSIYAAMVGLLQFDGKILGVVYLDRRVKLGAFGEEQLIHLGDLLQAHSSSLARLLKEGPDFAHLGWLSPDLHEVGGTLAQAAASESEPAAAG